MPPLRGLLNVDRTEWDFSRNQVQQSLRLNVLFFSTFPKLDIGDVIFCRRSIDAPAGRDVGLQLLQQTVGDFGLRGVKVGGFPWIVF